MCALKVLPPGNPLGPERTSMVGHPSPCLGEAALRADAHRRRRRAGSAGVQQGYCLSGAWGSFSEENL